MKTITYAFEEVYNSHLDLMIDNLNVNYNKCAICKAKINNDKIYCGSLDCKREYFKNKYKLKDSEVSNHTILKNALGKGKKIICN